MKLIDFIARNKKMTIGFGAILILIVVFTFALPRNNVAADDTYQIESVTRGNLSTVVGATGTVHARQSAVLAWKSGGTVEAVNARMGEAVRAGEVLAVLERASLPQDMILAEASLVSAQQALDNLLGSAGTEAANAAVALRDAQEAYDEAVHYRELLNDLVKYDVFAGFKRIKTPIGSFKIPKFKHIKYYPNDEQKSEADQDVALRKAELDDAIRAYEHLKDGPNLEDIRAAEARVAAAQAVLDEAKIIAPFDGVITDSSVKQSDRVSASEVAFRVEDLSSLLIDLEVSEVDINSVSVGQEVALNFDAIQGRDYRGVVIEVAGAGKSSAGSVNFRVTVKLTDADEQVKPGMTAAAVIQVRNLEDVLLVPNRAIRTLNGQRIVYVLKDDDSLGTVTVRLGATSDIYSQVVSGDLQEGDRVVLNPPATLSADLPTVSNAIDGQ